MSIYFPSGKYKLSNSISTRYLVHNILRPPKGCLVDDTNLRNFFSVLNLTVIVSSLSLVVSFFSLLFKWNIIFPLNIFFKHTIIDCISNLIEYWLVWLTDLASIHDWYSSPNVSNFYIICTLKRFWLIYHII